jgi:3-phenylpropionate/trans-cinnamate dioxygenase ferredoxin reductase subunit
LSAARPVLAIVGASYAGTQLAASARDLGFEGRILMIGDEPHLPYQRPPLSKGLLTGKATAEQLGIKGPDFYAQNGIEMLLGARAQAVDAAARRLTLANGEAIEYDWLALATGARCRKAGLPGEDLQGVFHLRTLDDALQLAAAGATAKRACVIGGGFIGLEVASALRAQQVEVTVVEAQSRLLARSFPPDMSAFIAAAHRRRGIDLRLGHAVRALHGTQGRVSALELDSGERLDCDLVVFGIGVVPNVELAQAAGIAVDNGVLTDTHGRSSVPGVLAIGDVANMALHPVPGGPARMRLESIQAANDGARAAATVVAGREPAAATVPWFWSDQFDLKLQMTGLPMPGDETVLRGAMDSERFSLFYLRGGALVASHSVNKPAEHMQSRKLIAAGARLSAAQLGDASFDLKSALSPS